MKIIIASFLVILLEISRCYGGVIDNNSIISRSSFPENFEQLRLQHIENFRKIHEMNEKFKKSVDHISMALKPDNLSQIQLFQSYDYATKYIRVVKTIIESFMVSYSTHIQNLAAKHNEPSTII